MSRPVSPDRHPSVGVNRRAVLRGVGIAATAPAAGLALAPATASAAPPPGADTTRPSRLAGLPLADGAVERAVGRLDALAAEAMARTGIPGMALAVVRDGTLLYAKGFGVRDVASGAPVDAETVFQLASVSKPIGATVIARQVAAGTVSWDTPVVDLLPWFALSDPWVTGHVTIGDLYAHRSGLPDHAGDLLEDIGHDRRTVLERLRLLPLHPFRAHYAYTNFGLTAAAEAVAAAAGTDWESLSEETLYRPLGMTATSSRFADFVARANRAANHVPTEAGYRSLYQRRPDAQTPAGGVSSNVLDMARWMALVLGQGSADGRELIPPDALLPAVTPQAISGPPATVEDRAAAYGFGFGVSVLPSGRVALSHSGAFGLGAATNVTMIPSLRLGIVALTNALPTGAAESVATAFAEEVEYGARTRDWLGLYGGVFAAMMGPVGSLVGQRRPDGAPPPRGLAAYEGRYDSAYFGAVTVARDGEGLSLSLGPAALTDPLEPWDGDSFAHSMSGENAPPGSRWRVRFDGFEAGRATRMTVEALDENGLGTFTRTA